MRKLTAVFLVVLFLCMLLSSCSTTANESEANGQESEANGSESETSQIDTQEWMHTECSKDYVKEFMAI